MKVGDKLVCKREYYHYQNIQLFYVGEYYIIRDIMDNEISIYFKGIGWTTFFIDKNKYTRCDYFYLYDYFYTEKEIRKLKLESIESGGIMYIVRGNILLFPS